MEKDLIASEIEEFTKNTIFSDLSQGDPLWDVQHTTAVVHHLKNILLHNDNLGDVDTSTLIIAAYAHDWGYTKFYKQGVSLTKEDYMKAKKTHAQIGYEKMSELLKNSVYSVLSEAQKNRVLHLIIVHDNIEDLKDKDEFILMEADTLGGLDTDFITSTWTKEQTLRHLEGVSEKRLPKFITQYGKQEFEKCYQKRLNAEAAS
jgi:hypothetical protein